jgi:hypothetical protein
MDSFGTGIALKGAVRVMFASMRTTSLVQNLKSGDTVVFLHAREANRVKRLCLDRGVEIIPVVSDVRLPHETVERAVKTHPGGGGYSSITHGLKNTIFTGLKTRLGTLTGSKQNPNVMRAVK